MAIVKEDGTGLPTANSYADVDDLVTFAEERGVILPEGDPAKEILLIKAMDAIETYDNRFRGERYTADQALSYPRYYDRVNTGIPAKLIKAQLSLAVAAMTVDLLPNREATLKLAKRTTVGPITIERDSRVASRASVPLAESLLYSLFGFNGQPQVIRG